MKRMTLTPLSWTLIIIVLLAIMWHLGVFTHGEQYVRNMTY